MKEKTVSINSILLDTINPRFDPVSNQSEAVLSLLDKCGDKIVKLASDIISMGTNPSDIVICTEEKLPSGKTVYVAKEGNRRLLAIKAIIKPETAINANWRQKFARLAHSAGGIGKTPKKLRVQVYSLEEEDIMKHWIAIKHDGENGGAGTVPWGSEEKSRFTGSGRNQFAVLVKTWLGLRPNISQDDKSKIASAPITTLDRILSSAQGRVILGVSFEDGKLHATRRIDNVANNLLEVIRDLTTPDPSNPRKKKINVSDVKNTEHIQRYLSKFERDDDSLPSPVLINLDSNERSQVESSTGQPAQTHGSRGVRATPSTASLTYLRNKLRALDRIVSNGKLKKLISEMLQIQIDKMPLVYCFAFRSLLDISAHVFAHNNQIRTDGVKLKDLISQCKVKISTCSNWNSGSPKNWVNDGVSVLSSNTMFSITELNNLVHGTIQIPSYDSILAYAPRVIPFLIALNGGNPPAEA